MSTNGPVVPAQTSRAAAAAAQGIPGGEFLGHPKGLYVLFFTELWERFGFYGMKALLTLYMLKFLLFEEKIALGTFGAYVGLVYATPLLGGMLADRLLGFRRAIVIGGILMAAGYAVIGLPTSGVATAILPKEWFFFAALGLIIAGNGFFKPNISTMVGKLYPEGDSRRDGGFTIFYMGINIGATLSPLVCGYVGETYGWAYGFGIASVGMIVGLVTFLAFGERSIGSIGDPPDVAAYRRPQLGVPKLVWVLLGVAAFVPVAALLLQHQELVEGGTYFVLTPVVLLYMIFEMTRGTARERGGILMCVILTVFSIVFWACLEQAGSSLTVFTEERIDRTFMGAEIKTSLFQAVNPLFVVLLAIPFAGLWTALRQRRLDPPPTVKFGLGLILLAGGFYCLVIAAKQAQEGNLASLWWVVLSYFVQTTGELCLSPVGLSTISRLAPVRLAGLMMGIWFLSSAFAGVLSGVIAKGITTLGFEGTFATIVKVAAGAGVLLLILSPLLNRLISEGPPADAERAVPAPGPVEVKRDKLEV